MGLSLKNNFRALLFIFSLAWTLPEMTAQLSAYYSTCVFNTPQNKPYLETYFTIVGKSLFAQKEEGQFRNSVHVRMEIFKDTSLVKINKYNLVGPLFADAGKAPSFIDNQRYSLPNGNYSLVFTLSDNHNPSKKPLTVKNNLTINFNESELQCSEIQPLESFSKANSPGPLTKSGYDLVPYTVNYYPESINHISFYLESYNADKSFGADKNFVYTYYLQSADKGVKLQNFGAFKKQKASSVNPLLARMDISKLGTGDYYLVVDITDENNVTQKTVKYFFQRLNRQVDVAALAQLSEIELNAAYFGKCENLDTLKMFVECLWPIADGVDKERVVNHAIKKDGDEMKKYVIDFWQRRAADTADPVKMWGRYYKNVQDVLALFKCGKQKGYYSDRGRVYLQYGAPSQRSQQPNEHNTYPYEIWQYYRTTDGTNGQFYSNRKFVFVNRMLGDDCYMLVHSDMIGEINNPRWQFDVTRRNTNGIQNPDQNTPANTEHNQFNDIYSNPR